MPIRGTRAAGSFPGILGPSGPPFMEATGGSVSTSGDYKIHTYNSGGSFVVSALGTDSTYGKAVNIVAVGGGGGGGGDHGGGGGGGGMVDMSNAFLTVAAQTYPIGIGSGGSQNGGGQGGDNRGDSGGNTTMGSLITAQGGGGGAGWDQGP